MLLPFHIEICLFFHSSLDHRSDCGSSRPLAMSASTQGTVASSASVITSRFFWAVPYVFIIVYLPQASKALL